MPQTDGKIDVHHHMVPEFYRDHLQRLGVDQAAVYLSNQCLFIIGPC